MDENNELPHTIQELSDFLYATKYLDALQEMLKNYPELIERSNLLKTHNLLTDYIEKSLQLEKFTPLKEMYTKPEFSINGSNDSVKVLFSVPLSWISLELKGESFNFSSLPVQEMNKVIEEIHTYSYKYISNDLRNALESLQIVMVLDCHIPQSISNVDFLSKSRLLFILSKYIEIYSEYILYRTTACMWYNPDPMIKLNTSLKLRVLKLIELLDIKKMSSTILDLFEMPLEDVDAIPEHIGSMVNNTFETLEILHSKIGHETFSLTEQEQLFIDTFNNNFQENRARAEKHFHNFLNNTEKSSSSSSSNEVQKKPTCFEYIRDVELCLRNIIKKQYLINFDNNWLIAIEEAIGEISFQNAINTMEKRKVTNKNEFLHYTTLPDLQQAIKNKWDLFKDVIPLKRKEFNLLFIPILKGRTEEAHNRPEHLWSEIEQQRVRVACHDLLLKIKKS